VAEDARYRCGYCLTPRHFTAKQLHVEHIVPIAAGGGSDIANLWLACDLCNSYKGARTHAVDPQTGQTVPLFHPRQQNWRDHFAWESSGLRIVGLTPIGRATIHALKMNNAFLVEARMWWVEAGWHPPED
jgi:5-methylcytosine-specific restriction endonuclease McrA